MIFFVFFSHLYLPYKHTGRFSIQNFFSTHICLVVVHVSHISIYQSISIFSFLINRLTIEKIIILNYDYEMYLDCTKYTHTHTLKMIIIIIILIYIDEKHSFIRNHSKIVVPNTQTDIQKKNY